MYNVLVQTVGVKLSSTSNLSDAEQQCLIKDGTANAAYYPLALTINGAVDATSGKGFANYTTVSGYLSTAVLEAIGLKVGANESFTFHTLVSSIDATGKPSYLEEEYGPFDVTVAVTNPQMGTVQVVSIVPSKGASHLGVVTCGNEARTEIEATAGYVINTK